MEIEILKEQNSPCVIDFCGDAQLRDLMTFIDRYWKKGHILSSHKRLMDWQHYDARKRRYTFAIARDRASQEVLGILGFISTAQFDPDLEERKTIWLAVWKVRDDVNIPGLGLALRSFITSEESPAALGTVGFGEKTAVLYSRFGYQSGTLRQSYIVNRKKKNFHLIAKFDGRYDSGTSARHEKISLVMVDKNNFRSIAEDFVYRPPLEEMPVKSLRYFYNRYLEHPVYHYDLYALRAQGKYTGLFVIRRAKHRGHFALRMVDFWGPEAAMSGLKETFQKLLAQYDAEYLDFFNYGISREILAEAGFLEMDENSGMVVPNYYEPFEQRNIPINFAVIDLLSSNKKVKSPIFDTDEAWRFNVGKEKVNKAGGPANFKIFRGDCDQDRPNSIPG